MATYAPPKFKPFTKTKVVLSLEQTPMLADQRSDITAIVKTGFRDATGQGPDSDVKGPEADILEAPKMFVKKISLTILKIILLGTMFLVKLNQLFVPLDHFVQV